MTQYIPPTSQGPPPGASRPRVASYTEKYVPDEYKTRPPMQQQPSAPVGIPGQGRPRGPSIAGQPITATPPVANAGYYGSSPGHMMASATPMGVTPPVANAAYFGASPGYFGNSPGKQAGYFGTPQPAVPYPNPPQHPGYPSTSQPQQLAPPPVNQAGHIILPPQEGRRPSASSTHSHRSGRSRHSGRSSGHHSRRESPHRHQPHRRHSEDSYGYDDDDGDHVDRPRRRERHFDRDRRYSEGASSKPTKPMKPIKDHRPSWGDTIYSMFGVFKDALGPRDRY